MSDAKKGRLLVGLGNPGLRYVRTRHNLGYWIVEEFARYYGWTFQTKSQFHGQMAFGKWGDVSLVLLLPTTYMNESGRAIRAIAHYYRFHVGDLLVVVDDCFLPFGEMRYRPQGSSGGHNGLKSVSASLGTMHYPRLRVGIGSPPTGKVLTDYVLEPFLSREEKELPAIFTTAREEIEHWLSASDSDRQKGRKTEANFSV